jgi:hypothetical protein
MAETRESLFEPGRYLSIPLVLLRRVDLTPAAKLVWIALAGHLRGDATQAWPSAARLAWMTGLARDTVMAAVAALEGHELLAVEKASGRSNVYRILQPEAAGGERGGRSEKPTGRKNPPVGKGDTTSRKNPPEPVGKTDTKYLSGTQGSNSPLTPQGGADCSSAAAENTGPATAEQAVERVDAAWRKVFGEAMGLCSRDRRKVRRAWKAGDAWLARVDVAAIRAGMKRAKKADCEFGLGWVRKAIEASAAAAQAAADAEQAQGKAAAAAAEQAAADQARRKAEAQAQREYFASLPAEEQEAWRRKASARPFASKRADLLEVSAALLAWRERE